MNADTTMAGGQRTYAVLSLVKSAYYACNETQRSMYYECRLPHVDLQNCCESLFKVVKLNTDGGRFDPDGDRLSTFSKLSLNRRHAFAEICFDAAVNGHVDCLRFGHEIGVQLYMKLSPVIRSACTYAASMGMLECLVYAHQNGCPLDSNTCSQAAAGGHLSCLKYAHVNGAPWDESTCTASAKGDQLECLRYAHQNGCRWDANTLIWAAMDGCYEYAKANGCHLYRSR